MFYELLELIFQRLSENDLLFSFKLSHTLCFLTSNTLKWFFSKSQSGGHKSLEITQERGIENS